MAVQFMVFRRLPCRKVERVRNDRGKGRHTMNLKIIPLNVVEEKVYPQLFPPDGDYVAWIRDNNPDYPEFEARNVKLFLFHSKELPLKENETLRGSLFVPERYESLIREHIRKRDGFGGYDIVCLEVDMELILLYTRKKVTIERKSKGHGKPTIYFHINLDDYRFIKDWVEAGMPEPWKVSVSEDPPKVVQGTTVPPTGNKPEG